MCTGSRLTMFFAKMTSKHKYCLHKFLLHVDSTFWSAREGQTQRKNMVHTGIHTTFQFDINDRSALYAFKSTP